MDVADLLPNDAAEIASVLFERILAEVDTPRRRASLRAHAWRLGPWRIEQRHLGHGLEPLFLPAWDHLARAAPGGADLTVYCCDMEAAGIEFGPVPLSRDRMLPLGEMAGLEDSDFRVLWDRHGRTLHLLDRRRAIALCCLQSRHMMRSAERSFPLRNILYWWAAGRGVQFIHAGGVGTENGGVLLMGGSGAGKSTASLACLGSRLRLLGDDLVLVAPGEPPMAYSLSATAKLWRGTLRHFPDLTPWDSNPLHGPEEKALFFPDRIRPGSMLRGFPLKALLATAVADGTDSRIEPMAPAALLRAVGPSSMFLFPGEKAVTLARMADLVRRLPCFRLESGSDLGQIPERIASLLDRL